MLYCYIIFQVFFYYLTYRASNDGTPDWMGTVHGADLQVNYIDWVRLNILSFIFEATLVETEGIFTYIRALDLPITEMAINYEEYKLHIKTI